MEKYVENANLELKEDVTDCFLKTVSAFANYGNGTILFGVSNSGEVLGLDELEEKRLQIEHKINDQISPRPDFSLELLREGKKNLLRLRVRKGEDVPYLYRGRAYKRSDSSTMPMDQAALRRLVLSAPKLYYDTLPSREASLRFTVLEEALAGVVGLDKLTEDALRTMGLLNKEGYTIAGELLADENQNLNSSTQIIRFGDNISIFLERREIMKKSILTQLRGAMELFDKWYQPYEEVDGLYRVKRVQVPRDAYREAVVNALIHRRYDEGSSVRIAMYQDRIEVMSPGGLPEGLSEENYLYGRQSQLRNPVLAEVFHRLKIIEKFGTGVSRIRKAYDEYPAKPLFKVDENFITLVLPLAYRKDFFYKRGLDEEIMLSLGERGSMSRLELERATGYSKTRVYEVLKDLLKDEKIRTTGNGPSTRYELEYG